MTRPLPARRDEHFEPALAFTPSQLKAANAVEPRAGVDALGLALATLVPAAMSCFALSDGDLGFHLATGREVLRTGAIPTRNVLSFAEPQHVWGLHQWLPALGLELLHRSFGSAGVIGAKMTLVAAIWAVVYRSARRLGAGAVASALSCLLGASASAFRFEARPFLFTHLTLSLILLLCIDYAQTRRKRALCAAAIVSAVSCQLHAGALDGFIALGLFALGAAIEPLRARFSGSAAAEPSGSVYAAAAVGGAAAGALLLAAYHPLGASVLLFPFRVGSDAYLAEHVVELRRPWAFPVLTMAGYWLMLLLWAAAMIARARVVHAAWLLLGLAFGLLSLRFVRMGFVFAIVAAPSLALALEHTRLRVRPRLAALLLGALALAAPLYSLRGRTAGFGYEPITWPLRHFDFIRAHGLQGNVFVSDAWGGPFLGTFYPERRVFFDNRIEAYSPGFIRDVYQRIRYGAPGWDGLLDRYQIEVLLLRYTSAGESRLQRGAPNLRQRLAHDPRYTLLRFDDVGELFVRTRGANAALASRAALPGVDPDRRSFTGDPGAAAPALLRALEAGERSATLYGMTALALHARGQDALARGLAREALQVDPDDAWAQQVSLQLTAAQ